MTFSLPANYGEVLTDLGDVRQAKVGLVMPIYGRMSYLKRALNSLAESKLDDVVICLVDETNAAVDVEVAEGFTAFDGVDSPGHGFKTVRGTRDVLVSQARSDERCLAFTSAGQLKSRVALILRKAPGMTLYVRNDHLRLRPLLRTRLKFLCRSAADPQAEALVRSWSLEGTPVVKVIKKKHGNMFDSYKHGFRFLAEAFGCEYFVCLDSDTLVKPHWLERLLELHERFSKPERPLLVSGFHTNSHTTIIEGQDHRQKGSLGGANLLFNKAVWHEWVQPSLNSVFWDVSLGREISKVGGMLVTSKPSVVDHIGRQGVWSSWLNFDKAADY